MGLMSKGDKQTFNQLLIDDVLLTISILLDVWRSELHYAQSTPDGDLLSCHEMPVPAFGYLEARFSAAEESTRVLSAQ